MSDNRRDDNGSIKAADPELLRVVEEVIDKGATTAEEIHRAVGELPISVLEGLGLEETASRAKSVQDRSIGAIYKLIREVNHQVTGLATDLLAMRDEQAAKKKQDS